MSADDDGLVMIVRRRLPLVLAVIGMVAVGGCTVPSSGTPLPASSTVSGTTEEPHDENLPSDGAPKVENPLDASHFEQKPCDVLTPEAAGTLNIPPTGEQKSNPVIGESCLWYNRDTGGSLAAIFYSEDKAGLSSVYREARAENWAYFERIDDIEGHPAIAFTLKEEKPEYGCVVVVGLTDQLTFSANVSLSDANVGKSDPCSLAVKAAGMMTKTMQEAA